MRMPAAEEELDARIWGKADRRFYMTVSSGRLGLMGYWALCQHMGCLVLIVFKSALMGY
jgi:hypothetical protein